MPQAGVRRGEEMGKVRMKFSNATRHFQPPDLGANRRSRVQGYRALKLSLRAEPTGVHRRGRREINRRLHSLTRPEIAICFLVDATRCLVDDVLYSNNSSAALGPTGPRRPGPTVNSGTQPMLVDGRQVGRGNPDVDHTRELDSGCPKAALALRVEQARLRAVNFLGYQLARWINGFTDVERNGFPRLEVPRPRPCHLSMLRRQ